MRFSDFLRFTFFCECLPEKHAARAWRYIHQRKLVSKVFLEHYVACWQGGSSD